MCESFFFLIFAVFDCVKIFENAPEMESLAVLHSTMSIEALAWTLSMLYN